MSTSARTPPFVFSTSPQPQPLTPQNLAKGYMLRPVSQLILSLKGGAVEFERHEVSLLPGSLTGSSGCGIAVYSWGM